MHCYTAKSDCKILVFQWYSFITGCKEVVTMMLEKKAALSF